MSLSAHVNSFNAGELSPYMGSRSDVKKYQSGCKTLENFIILPYGGVIRRPGTQYLGPAKLGNRRCRLIGFNFSTTTRFVIEMGHQYMRFWSNGARVEISSVPVEVASPYTEDQLRDVQFIQINDIMYFVHPDVAPHKLSRITDTSWTMAEVVWDWPALLEENVTNITVNVDNVSGNYRRLYSSAPLFNSGHVGGYWQLAHTTAANYVELDIKANATSSSLSVFGDWEFSTSGIWSAELNIEQSEDNGTNWRVIRTFKGAAERNVTVSGKTDKEVLLRIKIEDYITGSAWAAGTNYALDTVVSYENNIYKCVLAHNNTAAAWAANTSYSEGAFVTYNTRTYKCIKTHNNTTSAYANNQQVAVDTQFDVPNEQPGVVYRAHTAYAAVRSPWSGTWPSADKFANQVVQENAGTSAFWRVVENVLGSGVSYNTARTNNDIQMLSGTTQQDADYEMNRLEKIDYRPFNGEYWEPIDFTPFNSKYWTPINYSTRVARLEATDSRIYGFVKITSFTSSTEVMINVISSPASTAPTKVWAQGAWSGEQGYPRTVALHESRIYFGGTAKRPLSLWASVVDDFQNLRVSDSADAGLFLTLSAKEANRINWMESQDKLMIGTSGNEWTLGPLTADEGITPSNVKATKQSAYGSKYMASSSINEVMLFVQRQGRKVRELTYVLDRDGWVAPDLTILSEHVTAGEIVEADYQQQSDAIYWAIRGDGQLIGMTYERDQEVVGWHRHTTDGLFESVAVIYGGASGSDEVWLSVQRTINGQTVRYIERFAVNAREQYEAENQPYYWYMDCAIQKTSGLSFNVTGLAPLVGKTCSVLADGKVLAPQIVTAPGNSITLPSQATVVLVGLPYTSTLEPMIFDIPNMEDGHSRGRMRRIDRVMVTLQKSLGGQVSTDGNQWNHLITPTWENLYPSKWNYLYTKDLPGDPASPTPFSGDAEIVMASDYGRNLTLKVRQVDPLPLTILALTPKMTFHGD